MPVILPQGKKDKGCLILLNGELGFAVINPRMPA